MYDLGTDIAAREDAARQLLGKRAATEVVEGVFVFASPGRGGVAGAVGIARRTLAAYFNGRFEKRPTRAVSVYLYPGLRPYNAWCQKSWNTPCDTPYGFYLQDQRTIVMNVGPGIGTLTHELVHPLVEADFPGAPTWLDEGIASLFERFGLTKPGEIHGYKNWRHPRLLRALRSKKEHASALPSALFGMDGTTFRNNDEDLHYATARYLCQWLDEHKKLWAFYHRYRDNVGDDPTGRQSFTAVVGKPPKAIDAQWARWVGVL